MRLYPLGSRAVQEQVGVKVAALPRVRPQWGYDSNGAWVMLNRAAYEADQAARHATNVIERRDARARRLAWLHSAIRRQQRRAKTTGRTEV